MNFLTSIKRGDKITPDPEKPKDTKPIAADPHGSPQLPSDRSEPHRVSAPNLTEGGVYWANQEKLPRYVNQPVQGTSTGGYVQASLPVKKARSYGGVVVDEFQRVLLREPANHFDGYVWTFPKGAADFQETPVQTALREVLEETGYQCELIQDKPFGEFNNQVGIRSSYYLMRPVQQMGDPDKETQSIRWVSFEEAETLIRQSHNRLGCFRDLAVLRYAKQALTAYQKQFAKQDSATDQKL